VAQPDSSLHTRSRQLAEKTTSTFPWSQRKALTPGDFADLATLEAAPLTRLGPRGAAAGRAMENTSL
jgi:hypothetical protein